VLQTRNAAVQAKEELNGILLHDLELKIGWGKAIVIPPIPVYTAAGVPVIKQGASIAPPGVEAMPPWVDPHAPVDIHQGRGMPFMHHMVVQIVWKGEKECLFAKMVKGPSLFFSAMWG
jgi:hypothetical protein